MLETQDLILDKGKIEDWHDMYINLWSHDESAEYMLWEPTHSEEDAKARMQRTIAFEEKFDNAFIVYEKSGHRAIGFAGIREISPGVYEETGIAIGPAFVRRGYGKQILRRLISYAFDELGGNRFIYHCRSNNEASRALQHSCGFHYISSEELKDPRNGKTYLLEKYELFKKE